MFGRPVPAERPDHPFTGYKLARLALSADGHRAGFAGLAIGARRVYGTVAEAACVWNRRHAPPKRRCGCGFYCLSTLDDAIALSCATENRAAVLLEVAASGRFIRYDRGLRYSRQRVRAVRPGACSCGRPGMVLLDAGSGVAGWRHLAVACPFCAPGRPHLTFGQFASRLDRPVRFGADISTGLACAEAGPEPPGREPIAVLSAELALMQARLDDLQARVARYYSDPGGSTSRGPSVP